MLKDRLHLPIPGVISKGKVDPQEVGRVLYEEYGAKRVVLPSAAAEEVIVFLKKIAQPDLASLLETNTSWRLEQWPIKHLRMTQMQPPESDTYELGKLILAHKKSFLGFAEALRKYPDAIATDPGFSRHPIRDNLPIIGVRGVLRNHVLDGHHRTILAVWDGREAMDILTAYKG